MKNKIKKTIKILSILLLIVIINSVGYTYAKYISGEKGTGNADIANWSFKIKKDEGETVKNIKLASTIYDAAITEGKIAPGTEGQFYITADATGSEVDVQYSIRFENEVNKPQNIKFIYQGREYSSLAEIGDITGKINCNDEIRVRHATINWEWKYETGKTEEEIAQNDIIDTQDGMSVSDYTFDIVVTGTQSE